MTTTRRAAPDGYVSVDEAARQLGIARANGYRLIKTGQLPAIERYGQTWVPVESITARLRERHALMTDCIMTKEVADFFGVHPVTVLVWYRNGLIPARRISNVLCFSLDDVVAFEPPKPSDRATRTLRGKYYRAA